MRERNARSPRIKARVAGVFYLLTFVMGAASPFAGGKLVIPGDAAATAANILAHEQLFRLHFADDMIEVACYIAVTALFYELFEPVNRSVSRIAAFFSLVGCATQAALCCFSDLAPMVVLGGGPYLKVFTSEQLQALSFLFIKLAGQAFNINLALFGFYCVLIGYLIFQSSFLPRILGVLMVLGGLGWLTFLFPSLVSHLYPYNLGPGIVGEASLTLWLLVAGVNAERWHEQAGAARDRTSIAG